MDIVELPLNTRVAAQGPDFRQLSEVLLDSAELLEEAQDTKDASFREAAIELAVRSLRAAAAVVGRQAPARSTQMVSATRVLPGPWPPMPSSRRSPGPRRRAQSISS